ncbi:MAG TPA: PIG-L family deacetylase [Vicinamibacterales bacterium]|nr:PIG-L family deacetylase [Vicinamibacterales bacterium]
MGSLPKLLLSLTASTRLLVISPHPDDGTLGAGGLIARAAAAHASVRVVQMTSGDAFSEGVKRADRTTSPTASEYRAYGERRERETVSALGALGIKSTSIAFLGFPDEGLCQLTSRYTWTEFVSPYTRRSSPPPQEQRVRGVEYRGRDATLELVRIIESFAPTVVVLPDPADEHPDHCATHMLVHQALAEAERQNYALHPRELHYVIHSGEWPLSNGVPPTSTLSPPSRFRHDAAWRTLPLTKRERQAKRRALHAYETQMLMIGTFMRAFDNDNELFVDGEPATPPACWCEGSNISRP